MATRHVWRRAPRLGQVISRSFFLLLSSLHPCFTAPYPARPCPVDSSVADPSLAFRVLNGGPSCPIVSTIDSSSNGDPQGAALQTFLQRRKNGRGPLAPQPAVHWLGAPGSVPLLLHEVRLRGITHESGEQLALSRPRNCRVGPVDIPAGLLLLYTMRQAGLDKWWLMSVISRKSGAFPAPVRGFPSKSRPRVPLLYTHRLRSDAASRLEELDAAQGFWVGTSRGSSLRP